MLQANRNIPWNIVMATIFSLIAFAGNSVFCRLALADGSIDPSLFTMIRIFSGFLVLRIFFLLKSKPKQNVSLIVSKSKLPSFWLFLYAICFSLAYVSLDTGTGALVLFGTVQITLIGLTYWRGRRLSFIEGFGVIVAFTGLLYLLYPTLSTPSFLGFILMIGSGVSWGLYTDSGRVSKNPVKDTTQNFTWAVPWSLLAIPLTFLWGRFIYTSSGILYAILSGSLASAGGYVIWYYALSGLTLTQAASLQLLVPIIAAAGGVLFLDEILTMRLVIALIIILGGIGMVIFSRKPEKS